MDENRIVNAERLRKFCEDTKKQFDASRDPNFLAIDTEFQGNETYCPKLFLVQVANDRYEVAIHVKKVGKDANNWQPLWELLNDTSITKVFHDARQDVDNIIGLCGQKKPFGPIFDTQVAAMCLGYQKKPSFQELVKEYLGKDISKTVRSTLWNEDHITDEQFEYALNDVRYLRELYLWCDKELQKKGKEEKGHWRRELMFEKVQELNDTRIYRSIPKEPNTAWKNVKGSLNKGYRPLQFTLLMRLAEHREKIAKQNNWPLRTVLPDEKIHMICKNVADANLNVDKLDPKLVSTNSFRLKQIIDIWNEVKLLNESEWESPPAPVHVSSAEVPPADDAVLLLKTLLKYCSEKAPVNSSYICTSDELVAFSAAPLTELTDASSGKFEIMKGWRLETFGRKALAMKKGELGLTIRDGKVEVLNVD